MVKQRIEFGYNPPSGDRGIEVINAATYVRDLHEICDFAAQHFDTFWVSDHFMRGDTFRVECWTHMTWLAARYPTQTVGTVVIGNSISPPPAPGQDGGEFAGIQSRSSHHGLWRGLAGR